MGATVVIPKELVSEIRALIGRRSLGRFVREAVEQHLSALRRSSLLEEMEAGYAAETADPSLDHDWVQREIDDL